MAAPGGAAPPLAGRGDTIDRVNEPANPPAADETATATSEPPAADDRSAANPPAGETATAADEPASDPPAADPPADEPAGDPPAEEDLPAGETATAADDRPAADPPAGEPAGDPPAEEDPPAGETATAVPADPPASTGVGEASPDQTAGASAPQPAAEAGAEEAAADEAAADESAAPAAADRPAGEPGGAIGKPIPSVATTGGLGSGDIVSGTVTSVERREIELDLGAGRTGVIGSRHWAAGLEVDLTGEVQVGDAVEAAVLVREDHKQRIVLSRSWGRQQRAWETASSARRTGEIVSGTVIDASSAGLSVDIGVRAFVPASMAATDDLESLVGEVVECKVTEVNQLKGRCILSRKAALRTRERQAARKRLAELTPGTRVQAKVTKVENFGALVLAEGEIRGRIRRNELSWFRVRRPSDVVSVGDEVEAVVLQSAPSKMNLDLSLRVGDDPLVGVSPGERYQATVTSLAPFGAFVTLGDGMQGLVPTAELAEHPIRHPREVVVPGDSVLAEVTKVDRRRRDLELSVNLAVLVRPASEG